MSKNEMAFKRELDQFEEHMTILRASIKSGDTRMMAIAAVRFTSALLLFCVMPVFGEVARAEWKAQGRNTEFSKWLGGE